MNTHSLIYARYALPMVFIMVLAAGTLFLQQSYYHFRLENELAATTRKKTVLIEKQKVTAKAEKIFNEQYAKLLLHEKNLPHPDGYVWISKILQEAAPRLILTIDPPETNEEGLLSTPEYCTSIFRVRGTGSPAELFPLLGKIESNLPFTRVQEIQLGFTKSKEDQIEFSFSLLAVMRLNDEWDKPLQTALNDVEK